MSSWAKAPERGSIAVMKLGLWILNLFGYWAGVLGGTLAAGYFFATGTESRRASRAYLKQMAAFKPGLVGKPTGWKAFLHHWHFAINIMDRMWFWQGRLNRFEFTRHGREHVTQRQSGILLIGAHVGSFDALRAFSQDKGLKLNVVMYQANARNINALFRHLNPSSDIQVIELDPEDMSKVFELKDKVAAGEMVAILGDRPAPVGKPRETEFSFLGRTARFPQNPWLLAYLLECPVYFTVGLRTGMRKYHIRVEPLTDRVVLQRRNREAGLHAYMEQYVRRLEEICVAHPYQWFNFYDFWGNHA